MTGFSCLGVPRKLCPSQLKLQEQIYFPDTGGKGSLKLDHC